jgi:hypothetical protein
MAEKRTLFSFFAKPAEAVSDADPNLAGMPDVSAWLALHHLVATLSVLVVGSTFYIVLSRPLTSG